MSLVDRIEGVAEFTLPWFEDNRGIFARTFDKELFGSLPNFDVTQSSISVNPLAGTLRGMHYQARPSQEYKFIRCVGGSIFDVLIDLRNESPTYGDHATYVLSDKNSPCILIPPGIAHGFLTLKPNTYLAYSMTENHDKRLSKRILWSDPTLGIEWPHQPKLVSEDDRGGELWPVAY